MNTTGYIGFYYLYKDQVEFVLRSASSAITRIEKPSSTQIDSLANAYTLVLSEIAQGSAYENTFRILDWLTVGGDLNATLVPLIKCSSSEFDINNWLCIINERLFAVLNRAKIQDDSTHAKRKDLFLQLSRTLLLFVSVEAQQGKWKFTESKRFLKSCQRLELFQKGKDIEQYRMSFGIHLDFLDAVNSNDTKHTVAADITSFCTKFK